MELMITPAPTIYKPKMLWTGKQVVSSLLKHMCRPPLPQLNLGKDTRTLISSYLLNLLSFFFLSYSPIFISFLFFISLTSSTSPYTSSHCFPLLTSLYYPVACDASQITHLFSLHVVLLLTSSPNSSNAPPHLLFLHTLVYINFFNSFLFTLFRWQNKNSSYCPWS